MERCKFGDNEIQNRKTEISRVLSLFIMTLFALKTDYLSDFSEPKSIRTIVYQKWSDYEWKFLQQFWLKFASFRQFFYMHGLKSARIAQLR